MSIRQDLHKEMQNAIKNRDHERRMTLATVFSSLQNAEKTGKKPHEFNDEEAANFLLAQVRQRKASAEEYDENHATERADAERREIKVINEFIPKAAINKRRLQANIAGLREQVDGKEIGKAMRELKLMQNVSDTITAVAENGKIVFKDNKEN